MRIDSVSAVPIRDTRGRATLKATLSAGRLSATASVPSGKSTGSHEACELRDADGSVASALSNVNGEIADALIHRDFNSPDEIDEFLIALDGTLDKSRLGANAILPVSIAAQRLFAQEENMPLWRAIATRGGFTTAEIFKERSDYENPSVVSKKATTAPRLYVNMMNGGVHVHPAVASAKGDGFPLPFQEYLLVVEGKMSDAFPIAHEAFAKLGERLGDIPLGDEGGYAPSFDTLERPFELLAELVQEFPNTAIALDAAASGLLHDGSYTLLGKSYTSDELLALYVHVASQFPVHSIEDPFAENAYSDFTRITASLGNAVLIVGDDLTVTNPLRIKDAAEHTEINAVLIKPNQIGTVHEAIEAVQETYAASFATIASHRSGETDDTFISDFAYGIGAHGIKAGGLAQSERLAKYDRLLEIEQEAGML